MNLTWSETPGRAPVAAACRRPACHGLGMPPARHAGVRQSPCQSGQQVHRQRPHATMPQSSACPRPCFQRPSMAVSLCAPREPHELRTALACGVTHPPTVLAVVLPFSLVAFPCHPVHRVVSSILLGLRVCTHTGWGTPEASDVRNGMRVARGCAPCRSAAAERRKLQWHSHPPCGHLFSTAARSVAASPQ